MQIKMCLTVGCNHVENLRDNAVNCPSCGHGSLGSFETIDKFKGYLERYKPTNLKIVGKELKEIANQILGGS